MGKLGYTVIGAFTGTAFACVNIVLWFGWGLPHQKQATHVDATRADYVDLLLTVLTLMLGAIGLAVTTGAVVIGIVALKTLTEIKDEAAEQARSAAHKKIVETVNDELARKLLMEMARDGHLDDVLERVATKIQTGGPEGPDEGSLGR